MPGPAQRQNTWVVSGVCCSTEEQVLRKSLDRWIGSDGYGFNPITSELTVRTPVEEPDLLQHLRRAGFDARSKAVIVVREPFLRRHREAIVTGGSTLLAAAGIVVEAGGHSVVLAHALLLAAILLGGWKTGVKALKALRLKTLDMNVLMTVAVIGALAIGSWGEGAAVIVRFSGALMLESYSTARTQDAVRSLMAESPDQASVLDGDAERRLPASAVSPGSRIVIRPGEKIPLDGVVTDGVSDVDESPITGESAPRPRNPGDEVFAGSINRHGRLVVTVTARREDSMLARIVRLIESAQEARAPVQRFVDRFAAVYTPAVFAGAILVAFLPSLVLAAPLVPWIYRALVLLVIACPCALVIGTPVTIVSALTGAARRGILIKGGRPLETLDGVRAIAFDKTGTLTEGRPRVTDVIPLDSVSREEALSIIAALENGSEHPIAPALLAEAGASGGLGKLEQFEALPGRGVRGRVNGTLYFLGNERLCREEGFLSEPVERTLRRLANDGKTAMVLGTHSVPLCIVAANDTARHQGKHVVDRLRRMGIGHLVMLSGDHAAAAEQVAREVGLTEAKAGMLPEEKVAAIERLRREYGTVAMVGDGVNDAPALAASSVGIAMGVTGSGTALQTADVILMADDLSRLPGLIGLSRKTMHIVRQNIAIALGIKLLFLVLSLAGVATLWMALLADDGAALLVILNGFRALTSPRHI